MRRELIGTALALALLAPAASAQSPWFGASDSRALRSPVRARVWVDNDRDYFRRGDRLQIRFSTSSDAYVAVLHIDSDGELEFLYPDDPWDDQYVRGGRVYSVPRGYGTAVRGRSGIGYVYVVASPVPLDYSFFRATRGSWDWSYAGRVVRGDPFWALEQITRLLLPDWDYVPHAVDYATYYVEGRHSYPSYACSDAWGVDAYGWGWTPDYGACSHVSIFLRTHPYYYDSRRYHGDYRVGFRGYERADPRYRYKEAPRSLGWGNRSTGRVDAPEPQRARAGGPVTTPGARSPEPRSGAGDAARRPSLERRGSERGDAPEARPGRQAPSGTQRAEPRAAPAPRSVPSRAEPQRAEPPRAAPRPESRPAPRAAPTPRSEPRSAPAPRAAPAPRPRSDDGRSSSSARPAPRSRSEPSRSRGSADGG